MKSLIIEGRSNDFLFYFFFFLWNRLSLKINLFILVKESQFLKYKAPNDLFFLSHRIFSFSLQSCEKITPAVNLKDWKRWTLKRLVIKVLNDPSFYHCQAMESPIATKMIGYYKRSGNVQL